MATRLLNVGSEIIKNCVGDTDITDQEEEYDQHGKGYGDGGDGVYDGGRDAGYHDADADDQGGYDDAVADNNQDSNENGTVDGDNQPSNVTANNKDSTKNPIEPNGEGDNASSAAKETENEQTSDNNNDPAAANNANTTAPPPPQPQGQQQPQPKIKKESVPPPRELEEQHQVNNASDAPPKKQPQTQPEKKTLAKSIPSVQEKAPCPSSAVPPPEDDAATLYRAFKGKGCDVGKVMQILAERDSTRRNQIARLYKKNYDEELSDRISSEFSSIGLGDLKEQVGLDLTVDPTGSFSFFCSNIKRAITLWWLNESERDATIVRLSSQVTTFDKAAVTEVICSRTPSQLRSLKQAYFTKYSSRLLEDISASTLRFNGYHKELLIACLDDKTARDEGTNVDIKMAEEDAKQLYKDGEKRWGTNEKTFIEIFTKRNRPHLAAVDVAYEKLYGHSLEEAVKKETSGSFQAGLLTLLRCAKNSAKYFAEVLYNSMKGLGTSNEILLRTVVTKAGSIEMEDIKKEYSVAYKISLLDAIHKDTSGHYRTFLINLVE